MRITSTEDNLDPAVRWMAPELFSSYTRSGTPQGASGTPSDVWSLGMLAYELLSTHVPFYEIERDDQVLSCVFEGGRPTRPVGLKGAEAKGAKRVTDAVWEVLEGCWRQEPALRPGVAEVKMRLVQPNSRRSIGLRSKYFELFISLSIFY